MIKRSYTFHTGGCLNPAMAISLDLFHSLHHIDKRILENSWVYLVGSLGGAYLATLFFKLYRNLKTSPKD
jgi:aquaporin related protein